MSLVESVSRFKGLESSVVVLALDFRQEPARSVRWQFHVGMSRTI
jgi:hypothetical protein